MELSWDEILIDKRDVEGDPAQLLEDWRWLIPAEAETMLPTACGDLFLRCPDGSIALLDTYAGLCQLVAGSYQEWKAILDDKAEEWFRPGLIGTLLEAGLNRQPGECFSPLVPQVINGSWEPANFHACSLLVHLSVLGQIHQQVKDLPPGTSISGFEVQE